MQETWWDMGSIPRSGRSPGGGHGNPLQYSCLDNPMDRGVWQLQSRGLKRVRHIWSDWACTQALCLKRPRCWEKLKVGGEGDDRGWDGWMASPTEWAWVWVNSRSWWWTERTGVLQSVGSQRVRHDWAAELNWTELKHYVRWDTSF